MITIPSKSVAWQVRSLFVALDPDTLADLLVVGPAENTLWIYRQRASGFTDRPDQAIELPPQTAWITACDVDPHPGLELLFSTASGLVLLRQQGGVFEAQRHTLIEAGQVLRNHDPAVLIAPALLQNRTNEFIPVITATGVALYRRDADAAWRLQDQLPFAPQKSRWIVQDDDWMMGSKHPTGFRVQQFSRVRPVEIAGAAHKPENEAIRQINQRMNKPRHGTEHGADRADINGDGQTDVVLWEFAWDVDPKTDVFVFLRGPEGQFPDQPSQVLHARGFPLYVGPRLDMSPICDLDRDGIYELMLLALKVPGLSSGKVLEMVMSRGVDWNLTVRSFRQGAFAKSPDASINVSTTLPADGGPQALFVTDADFNGDGRPDVMARRSLTEWDVFLSTTDGKWLSPQPAQAFQTPLDGEFEIRDLNHDGISDIVVRGRDEPHLLILRSEASRKRGPQR